MTNKWLVAVAAAIGAITSAWGAGAAKPIDATLTIHADKPGAIIDPALHGQFMEHLGR